MVKNSNKKVLFIVVVLVAVSMIFSLSKSYAYFQTSIAGSSVTMVVGKLIHSLNSDVKLKKGEKKAIKLFVKNNDNVASKYQLYYMSGDDLTNVVVGYASDSIDTPPRVGK